MKATAEAKEWAQGRLGEIKGDLKKSKIKKSIDQLKEVDGKYTADFCVEGLPEKKVKGDELSSSYKRYPKIFDDIKDLVSYVEKFFKEDFKDEE
jgi:hypothetical protein